MIILEDYERALCVEADWPPTTATLVVMSYWNHLEGGDNPNGLMLDHGWNIWMTTWPDGPDTRRSTENIGFGPGKWNNANPPLGVGIYASMMDGIRATIKTIRADSRYAPIDQTFTKSQYIEGFRNAIITWIGSEAYSDSLDRLARIQYTPQVPPVPSPTPDDINSALQKRFAIIRLANDPELWKVEQAWGLLKQAGLL